MQRTLLFVIILAVLVAGCGKKGDGPDGPAMLKAAITYMKGDVQIEKASGKETGRIGAILEPGDVLVTGTDGGVEVMVQNMGALRIGSDSRIRIQSLFGEGGGSQAEIKLDRGDLTSMIKKQSPKDQYSVITPTAIAGVRGTTFVTTVERLPAGSKSEPVVSVAVLEGSVTVGMPGQSDIILEKNAELTMRGFQKLSKDMIRPLSREALESMKKMAVFHKTNVMEFRSLMADLQKASPEMQLLESDQTLDATMDERGQKTGLGEDSVRQAKRVDESRFIQRDTTGDPVKLKPESGFKE
ncbi:MAG: FecR domain-containing protein [Spirochaetales bacterium]|nr:FecR domain-containing protein [Spirochaetales bacterium]